ncbi:PspA/IM30 family protein [Streptomyces sp. NPDC054802]
MTKQTVLGRVAQLAKANINALLDQAEDPQKMLEQLIRDRGGLKLPLRPGGRGRYPQPG